jgi:signal transduction histidine kinase
MEALPLFVFLMGPDFGIRYTNRRFRDIFGEPDGRPCHQVLHGLDKPCSQCRPLEVLRSGRPLEYDWPPVRGRTYRICDHPFMDVDGSPLVLRLGIDVTERARLESEILDIARGEQQRIGQDLHDTLGQNLTGVGFLAKALEKKLAAGAPAAAEDAARISGMINEAIGQTRALARGLSPIKPEAGGLAKAFQELASDVETIFSVACSSDVDEATPIDDEAAATHLYRIAQEAVNNAVKHGRAGRIDIALACGDGQVCLTVRDDGVGLPDAAGRGEGVGLRIMDYRARIIGGTLDVSRDPAGGTRVVCSLPHCAEPR